jgi:hypothetical protein
MREEGYASGTINRVIVIVRYIYNLARKWKVPGGAENPAAGLSTGPEVQRSRFLTEQEAKALVRSVHADENQTAASRARPDLDLGTNSVLCAQVSFNGAANAMI